MKCEICDQEVANSEEMKAHMEREHPLDERGEEELEKPDLMPDQEQGAPIVPGKDYGSELYRESRRRRPSVAGFFMPGRRSRTAAAVGSGPANRPAQVRWSRPSPNNPPASD